MGEKKEYISYALQNSSKHSQHAKKSLKQVKLRMTKLMDVVLKHVEKKIDSFRGILSNTKTHLNDKRWMRYGIVHLSGIKCNRTQAVF